MSGNNLSKSTLDKLKQAMEDTKKDPDFVRGRALIEPKNKTELIKKRLCTKIIEFHLANKQIKREDLAMKLELNQSTLSFILNYHIDKISIDTLVKSLEKLSEEDRSINDVLKRMALV
jgi:predicted XRE-type DNA-binding protein